ncbi:MAG TPA: glycoside hydrolase family 15 protein [Gammaproteobacteria bacterium]
MSAHPSVASEPLAAWLERQEACAARNLFLGISSVAIVKTRPSLGQTVRPVRGAIVASHVLGAYDPDPDYFFHWFRDSALVIDALRLLHEQGAAGAEALGHLRDFVTFSLSLQALDGRALAASTAWRAAVTEDFAKFLRTNEELAGVHGESVAAETRVNPDGTLDVLSWPRPQHDGPALRALALLRWARTVPFDAELDAAAARLLELDLGFVRRRARLPCFDIWEEEKGLHYYTLAVSAAALDEGAPWLEARGERDEAAACRAEADAIRRLLDGYWREDEGYYRSRVLESGSRSTKELDIAVVLAAIHGRQAWERHSPSDPRVLATLERLERLFDAEYPINHGRPAYRGPALGRYPGDVYYSGGAYYFSTLGGAELCFRAAAAGAPDAPALVRRGDAFLETVRAFTPPSGCLSEQFCGRTGVQTSARHLGWSYAAFITCLAARRAALEKLA